jgi:hypothetical protein
MPSLHAPRLETVTLAMLAGISALYFYAALALIFAPAHFAALMAEIGPLESVGTFACFVAAILFFSVFIRALRSKNYGEAVWLLSLAVGTAFLALEEISWGQHMFGFATPPGISAVNAQGETNFHNIRGIHTQSHESGIAILFAFFVVAPLLATYARLAHIFETLRMPIVPLQIAALFAFAYGGFQAFRVLHNIFPANGVNYGELQETAYELIILLFAATLYAPMHPRRAASPSD